MKDLTAEELGKLPQIHAKTHVAELLAVHIHTHLPNSPCSVETDLGHFRLSARLSKLAAKAYNNWRDGKSTRPRKGRLALILGGMAGEELDPSEAASEELEETQAEADPLQGLAADMAKEALGRLEGLFQEAVAKQLSEQKEALIASALRKSLGR
jgi:hypothetical protein